MSTDNIAAALFLLSISSPRILATLNSFLENFSRKFNNKTTKALPKALQVSVKLDSANVPEVIKGRVLPDVCVSEIQLFDIPTLRDKFPSVDAQNDVGPGYNKIIGGEDFIIHDIVRKARSKGSSEAFVRAGPRSFTHFDPSKVRAGTYLNTLDSFGITILIKMFS